MSPIRSEANPRCAAVVVAAGSSTRMGASERKPFLSLGRRTMIEETCAALSAAEGLEWIVVVAHADDQARMAELARTSPAMAKVTRIVTGGASRTDSVRAGVEATPAAAQVIAVHDAARPLVDPKVVSQALCVAAKTGAALVAMPVRDTIKSSASGAFAESTLDRSILWSAQTPQCFRAQVLRELLERAQREQFSPTDDAALYERYIGPVPMVPGLGTNLKITTPEDLELARMLLAQREKTLPS